MLIFWYQRKFNKSIMFAKMSNFKKERYKFYVKIKSCIK